MIKKIGPIVLIQLSNVDSNIYLVGNTIIDSGTGFNFAKLYTALKALKTNFGNIKQIINTHAHFDHIGGNGYFLNAKLAIHELDAPVIEKGDTKLSMADFFDGKLKPKKVDQKLKETDTIKVASQEFKVFHTPGHTAGSICLYNPKTKILFSGDTIFADGIGRTDIPGGDPNALASSIDKISKLDVKQILPGHGEPVLENGSKAIRDILKG